MEARLASGIGVEKLLDPDAPAWTRADEDSLSLIGTPAGLQPTAAIRNTWTNRKIGAVERVQVRAVHDGEVLAIWDGAQQERGGIKAFSGDWRELRLAPQPITRR